MKAFPSVNTLYCSLCINTQRIRESDRVSGRGGGGGGGREKKVCGRKKKEKYRETNNKSK